MESNALNAACCVVDQKDIDRQVEAIRGYLSDSAEVWGDPTRAWHVRTALSRWGWHSEDRITQFGWRESNGPGFSIWFSRWKTYDGQSHHDKAVYHRHVADLFNAPQAVLKAALDALVHYNGAAAEGTSK
jgi:hypothetical protein